MNNRRLHPMRVYYAPDEVTKTKPKDDFHRLRFQGTALRPYPVSVNAAVTTIEGVVDLSAEAHICVDAANTNKHDDAYRITRVDPSLWMVHISVPSVYQHAAIRWEKLPEKLDTMVPKSLSLSNGEHPTLTTQILFDGNCIQDILVYHASITVNTYAHRAEPDRTLKHPLLPPHAADELREVFSVNTSEQGIDCLVRLQWQALSELLKRAKMPAVYANQEFDVNDFGQEFSYTQYYAQPIHGLDNTAITSSPLRRQGDLLNVYQAQAACNSQFRQLAAADLQAASKILSARSHEKNRRRSA